LELEFTPEQDELRSAIRSVLEGDCPITLVREVVEKGSGAETLWERQVELDWPALTVSSEHGGVGMTFIELAVLSEELGRVVAPGPLLATVSQFVPLLREVGPSQVSGPLLSRVAHGEISGTVALATAGGEWSPEASPVLAHRDGDRWRLEGAASWVMDAGTVDEIAVIARCAGSGADRDLAAFVVPAPEVAVTPFRAMDLSRSLATVDFDGVTVGPDRVLAAPASPDAIGRALQEATVALALETVGTCHSIFDIDLAYAMERKQFGAAIGSFQAMKHKFANMYVALEKARAVCYFAAATIAEDDERRGLAAAMAKAAAGDCEHLLGMEGIQTLGGIGYTWEHDMHLYVKRAKTNGVLFGGTRFHRARVAEALVGEAGSPGAGGAEAR
jgi:alkylation response protein AidB-like acyl-CoA dehydrogenase